MAIFTFEVNMIKRSKGHNAIAAAAYRSGRIISNHKTGKTYDYARKHNVDYSEIYLPHDAPEKFNDRETLWNNIEEVERRKDSQLARDFMAALPRELSPRENIDLSRNFCKEVFVSMGMVIDISFHNLYLEEPHFHVMSTTRYLTQEGFGQKNREWNNQSLIKHWRKMWEKFVNDALRKKGLKTRVSCLSNKARNIPTIPLSKINKRDYWDYNRTGSVSNRMKQWLLIQDLNKIIRKILEEIKIIKDEIEMQKTMLGAEGYLTQWNFRAWEIRQLEEIMELENEISQLNPDYYPMTEILTTAFDLEQCMLEKLEDDFDNYMATKNQDIVRNSEDKEEIPSELLDGIEEVELNQINIVTAEDVILEAVSNNQSSKQKKKRKNRSPG